MRIWPNRKSVPPVKELLDMSDDYLKVRSEYPPTVPLSHLALDLPSPVEGWPAFLGARGIAIIPDDLGRDAVPRQAARRLLDERREQVVREAALRRLAEQEAVEADERRRAQIWKGVPASALPDGVSPVQVMTAAIRDQRPKRTSVLEEALSNSGGLTYHPLPPTEDES
jgi:hypothetical protein